MKTYFYLVTFSVMGSLFLSLPDVAMFVTIITFGLGLILFFLPAVAYYLIASLPGVLLGSMTGNRATGTILAAICIAGAAYIPILSEIQEHKSLEVGLLNAKKSNAIDKLPRTIEIIRPAKFHSEMNAISYPEENCGPICKSLIESDQVDWVRVKLNMLREKDRVAFYQVGKTAQECKVPGSDEVNIPCVLIKPDNAKKADLTLVANFKYGEGISVFNGKNDKRFHGWLSYTATDNTHDEAKLIYSNRQQLYGYPVVPYILSIQTTPGEMGSGGIDVLRLGQDINPLDYKSMLIDLGYVFPSTLGETIKPDNTQPKNPEIEGPSEDQTRALISLLDLPRKSDFNQTQERTINEWLHQAHSLKVWHPEIIELVTRIQQDSRIGTIVSFDEVAILNEVAPSTLPIALDQIIEGQKLFKIASFLSHATHINKETLLLNKNKIKLALDSNTTNLIHGPLTLLGASVGIDPTPYTNRLKNTISKIMAYCFLEPKGNPKSIKYLRSKLSNRSSMSVTRPSDRMRRLLQALTTHGEIDLVTQIVQASNWHGKKRYLAQMIRFSKDREIKINNSC